MLCSVFSTCLFCKLKIFSNSKWGVILVILLVDLMANAPALVFLEDMRGVFPDDLTTGEAIFIVGHRGRHVEHESKLSGVCIKQRQQIPRETSLTHISVELK